MKFERSKELFDKAQDYLPGGVDSPVRAFKSVGGNPLFIKRGAGSKIWDEDDNEFIDYVGSWGPLILGHAHPKVTAAIKRAANQGTSFGASTELEITLARLISTAMPSLEKLRFVSSGTEAVMSALRVARAFTKRDKIIKCAGCYHGHSDGLLTKAGSGLATLGIPDCPGVPATYSQQTIVVPYNQIDAMSQALRNNSGEVAAVIVEPVAANMGVVKPRGNYLEELRELTRDEGALLIFDEVITGFRLGLGGAQGTYGIHPDLTCLGKIIGGGMPVGAYGGREDILRMIAPEGPVYQAGTLSGNPLAMTAGIETIRALSKPKIYNNLQQKTDYLVEGLENASKSSSGLITISHISSMFTIFFGINEAVNYDSVQKANTARYAKFFQVMLEEGIYLPPSQFEASFVSLVHDDLDLRKTIMAAEKAFSVD
ncbi:MAG: glutamate-1-semialdehyde 2,1-aminomutase [Chloroflexota bacterium]|nr:glutamate-1-semialdehyde 2,1-aminomutase [Chloroflexota bacterium]